MSLDATEVNTEKESLEGVENTAGLAGADGDELTSMERVVTEDAFEVTKSLPPLNEERRARTAALIEALCSRLYDREDTVRLALVSAVAGESIFLLGPPGIGKSLVARRLKYAFRDGVSFEYLMSRFSTPDEIFGPVSIKKLKDEDKYERLTDRYLPGANIVFLDEIWKAGPAIQNALLTVLNEKIYRNGEEDMKVDIKLIIAASNELPNKGKSLEPLWDRFLVRLSMEGIREQQEFLDMLVDSRDAYEDDIPEDIKLTQEELEVWDREIDQVTVTAEVLNVIQVIRHKLNIHNQRGGRDLPINIYDRRWKKIIRLLRTSAFLNGREYVDLMDCFLMKHCLWNELPHREILGEMIDDTIRTYGYSLAVKLDMLRQEIEAFEEEVNQEIRMKHVVTETQLNIIDETYIRVRAPGKPFDNNNVKLEEFRQLQTDEWTVISLFNQEGRLSSRLKARRSSKEFSLDLEFNSVVHTVDLETAEAERVGWLDKEPHQLIVTHWDERVRRLRAFLQAQIARIKAEQPGVIEYLDRNLFVDSGRSEIVRANLEDVAKALQQWSLRVEKLHHAYTSIG